jgi:hypothetical protein
MTPEEREKIAGSTVVLAIVKPGTDNVLQLQCRMDEIRAAIGGFIIDMVRQLEDVGIDQRVPAPPRGDA